jgi:hypothetical protein
MTFTFLSNETALRSGRIYIQGTDIAIACIYFSTE